MAVKKGLGRGLDMLIPQESKRSSLSKPRQTIKSETAEKDQSPVTLPISKVEPNRDQPRQQFDESAIDELAESIKQYGVLQPLLVRKKDNYYEIIAGERRWRACKKAGLKEVPVVIKAFDEKDILKIALIENIQRENLNPMEEAKAYQRLQEDYGLKQEDIANSLSKSRTVITNTMRLLKLDERVQQMIIENLISSGHGRTLLSLKNQQMQYEIALKITEEGLSVRDVEQLVKQFGQEKKETPSEGKKQNLDEQEQQMITLFEGCLKEILGSKVSIKNNRNNRGKIEIEYYSKEELERLIDLLQSIQI